MLSFIFRIPLTKFTSEDINNLEKLITTLDIKKPVLRASDFFDIDLKIVASVSNSIFYVPLKNFKKNSSWLEH